MRVIAGPASNRTIVSEGGGEPFSPLSVPIGTGMICLRPLLVILAFCLALVAPAQAGGWLDGRDRACLHPIAVSMQASAPDALPHDGIIAPPCHGLVAILETGVTLPAGSGSAEFAAGATRLDLPLRPAGIDRPPKLAAHFA